MEQKVNGKIAVVGAGAIGSVVGGLLAKAGEDVTLIARKEHVDTINSDGLLIKGIANGVRIKVKAAEKLDFHPDIILLAVKTQDVEEACRQIEAYIGQAVVVTLQNGVRSDGIVAGYMPVENIISGMVMFNAQYLQPGQVTYSHAGKIVIGDPYVGNHERLANIASLLSKAVKTKVTDNISGVHWSKLLVNNLSNGVEAMTGMSIAECMNDRVLKKISALTLREGYKVIRKAGYHPAGLPGAPLLLLRFIVYSPLSVAEWALRQSMKNLRTLSSTLQSIRRGKPTEIDYLNGEIVQLGIKTGMETPANKLVTNMVKDVEKTGKFASIAEIYSQAQERV